MKFACLRSTSKKYWQEEDKKSIKNMGIKGALRLVHSKILVAYLKNHI